MAPAKVRSPPLRRPRRSVRDPTSPPQVLFACVHNAGRSQMSCHLFNLLADPDKAQGISAGTRRSGGVPRSTSRGRRCSPLFRAAPRSSRAPAGTQPAQRPHPEVVTALAELGVDASGSVPQLLTADLAATCTLLITMGCGDACPHVPGLQRLDWPLQDPKGQQVEEVRRIRDDIRARVQQLVTERGWGRAE